MKIKEENGFTVADIVIAIIAILIFSTLIYSLMYTYVLENVKLKKENLAMIYMTEIFEKIAIADYTSITEENIKNTFITKEMKNMAESINVNVINLKEVDSNKYPEDILKKISISLTYSVGKVDAKKYTYSMERMKIKE